MALSVNNYQEIYQQAYKAYVQANYEEAVALIDQVVDIASEDVNIHLLRGHIYYVLQQFDIAKSEYESVIQLSYEQEIIELAQNGLDNVNQYQQQQGANPQPYVDGKESMDFSPMDDSPIFVENLEELANNAENTGNTFTFSNPNHVQISVDDSEDSSSNPFHFKMDDSLLAGPSDISEVVVDNNPFQVSEELAQASENLPDLFISDSQELNSENESLSLQQEQEEDSVEDNGAETNPVGETLLMGVLNVNQPQENSVEKSDDRNVFQAYENNENKAGLSHIQGISQSSSTDSVNDSFDFEAFESAFGSEDLNDDIEYTGRAINSGLYQGGNIEFIDDFDEFDDLGEIPGFNVPENDYKSSASSGSLENSTNTYSGSQKNAVRSQEHNRDDELFSITGSQEEVPVFTEHGFKKIEPETNVEQGLLGFLENASLQVKPWLVGGGVAAVSAICVASVSLAATSFAPPNQRESIRNTGLAMALAAGAAGAVSAGIVGSLSLKQIRRTTKDLQSQFDAVRQGNLNVTATVYSKDEFGQLATGFNEMARVIFTTTNEATRKAQEQEEAKENLQRQVIRLLDDVEGAARGDLTVQAEVTADVLGAVADAFNLTIQNLRDIVQQVKVAAREVTKGSTNSETFARALSSDALRQAEELAATLNSVQVMTDSIQRVAEAAREAEAVTHDASEIAQKGGEAVENTVAGILEIRETVAETTRKVKRLAESSQEISKIVALISQIASRTNLLALNASIEAARAGEAGRGFAIVADEVRQLADKSAKSLKEIEQIVMQIQSETGSVMTAMEEGTQQVIKGTKLAEEAKRSLDNIIHVADRIDKLVRLISADTVNQTETSRAVAQVMQSVELTAQETSQEAQRVSGALQNLVGVSRDLISSVERFRVETSESR
ncbi:Methyl-accepting chemotaxis protein [Richelia intracellularis]|nr:Methyl-accepting chemotaxis protein [Richelia intracellularis]